MKKATLFSFLFFFFLISCSKDEEKIIPHEETYNTLPAILAPYFFEFTFPESLSLGKTHTIYDIKKHDKIFDLTFTPPAPYYKVWLSDNDFTEGADITISARATPTLITVVAYDRAGNRYDIDNKNRNPNIPGVYLPKIIIHKYQTIHSIEATFDWSQPTQLIFSYEITAAIFGENNEGKRKIAPTTSYIKEYVLSLR